MFNNMKVANRLAIAFGATLALLLAIVFVGTSRMGLMNEGMQAMTGETVEMVEAFKMRGAAFQVSVSVRSMMLYADEEKLRTENQSLQKAFAAFESASETLSRDFDRNRSTLPAEKELLRKARASWSVMRSTAEKTAEMALANKRGVASTMRSLSCGTASIWVMIF